MNSANEIEPKKFLAKIRTISIADYGQPPISTMDIKNRQWTLTSNSTPNFNMSVKSHLLGFEDSVPSYCPSAWTGSQPDYVCNPGATQFTPETLTFPDG